ncbi:MAG: uroporphyrinogen-III C-methyltransferase [Opitutaceae bacterium]
MTREPAQRTEPGVYLVGAGPGDPELLTVKARRLVEDADALVYDHLVGAEILGLARSGCRRIFVGKQGGHACRPQSEIDELLVTLARGSSVVVRLKGGDPGVFGRGGEEASALRAAGIRFEIIPGVTAALGAAAYAGISLTHRRLSSAVVFLTGHEDPSKPAAAVRWEDYGRLSATLCIYMGLRNLSAIVDRLQAGGLDPDTPAALIQSATTAEHRLLRAPVAELPERAAAEGFGSPSIAIIGPVAAFADTLGWFEPALAAAYAP